MPNEAAAPALSGEGPIGRALAALERGDLARAAMLAARETVRAPENALAWEILSLAAYWRGSIEAALSAAGEAAALTPDSARRLAGFAATLLAGGQAAASEHAFRVAAAADGGHGPARQGLGERLLARGRIDEAEANLAAALRSPDHDLVIPTLARWAIAPPPRAPDLHAAISACRLARGDLGGAQASLQRALAVDVRHGRASAVAARIMNADGRPFDALALYQRALAASPGDPALAAEAAAVLHGLGQAQTAQAMLDGALAIAPGDAALASTRLRWMADQADRAPQALAWEHDLWVQGLAKETPAPTALRAADPDRPLRLGLMAGEAKGALADHLLAPLLAGLDRRVFEIVCYVDCAAGEAPAVVEAYAACGRPIARLSDEAIALRVEDDGVDILLDLAGHAPGGRPGVFARRPSPLQAALVSGLDSPARGPFYDAVIADEWSCAGGAVFFANARLVPLAGAGLVLALDESAPTAATDGLTLGYVGAPERLNAHVFEAWAEVLRRSPAARLLIGLPGLDEPRFRALIERRLAEARAPSERLVLVATPTAETARRARAAIDVALDPFPHSDGAAALAALALGVPAVALDGEPPFGRAAASILATGGLGDWIAPDLEAYLVRAAGAVADRAVVRRALAASSLCDGAGFAARIGETLLDLWAARCASAPQSAAERQAA